MNRNNRSDFLRGINEDDSFRFVSDVISYRKLKGVTFVYDVFNFVGNVCLNDLKSPEHV